MLHREKERNYSKLYIRPSKILTKKNAKKDKEKIK